MIKRPISFGAVLLIVILYIGNFLGVSETVPRSFLKEGSKVQLMGRVKARENTGYGIRLYLEECEILSTDFNSSNEISDKNSFNTIFNQSELQIKENSNLKEKKQVLVYLQEESKKISVGNWIIAEGTCGFFKTATNPGQFDVANYYEARGICWILKKSTIIRQWHQKNYVGMLDRIKSALQNSMEQVLGEENAAITAAITLGIREGLSDEMKQLYQEGGIAHVLAISSLHITLVGMSMYQLLRKLRCSLAGSSLISGVFLFSFCLMTGMSVSAKRACIMYQLWLGSQIFGRTNDQPTALGLASLLILVPSPEYLWDSSFLLSFGCILSIRYVQPLMKLLLPIPGPLGASLQTSAAIQLGTLPLVMMFFYQVTPYGVLVNLVVIPFMGILMVSGLVSAVIGLFSVPAGILAAAPCHYLLEWFEWLCRMERRLPGAVVITGCPERWQVILYYGILFFCCVPLIWWTEKRKKEIKKRHKGKRQQWHQKGILLFGGIMGMTLAVFVLSLRILPELRITFLDVGQGDGILVQSGDFVCMIDGGSSSVKQVWQYRIESTLKYYGIDQLDAVFVSHGDQDHISGVEELLENYETGFGKANIGGITLERLILPGVGYQEEKIQRLAALAKEKEISVGTLGAGGSVESGAIKLTCLYPSSDQATGDSNQDSMVLFLEYQDFTALFTGDLEKAGEERFLKEVESGRFARITQDGQIDLLKVAHHGSGNGTTEEFLKVFTPEKAVISCGENNSYGHPAQEVLERLENVGAEIVRTDQAGAVTVGIQNGIRKVKEYCH